MSRQITFLNISGSTFYNIWDDRTLTNEIPIAVGIIDDATPGQPYTITLPNTFESTNSFGINLLNGQTILLGDIFEENRGGISIPITNTPTPSVTTTPSLTPTPTPTVTPSNTQVSLQSALLYSCCTDEVYPGIVNIPSNYQVNDSVVFEGEHSDNNTCYYITFVAAQSNSYETINVTQHFSNDADCTQCQSVNPNCPSPTPSLTPTPTPSNLYSQFTFLSGNNTNMTYVVKDLPQTLSVGDLVTGTTAMYYTSNASYFENVLEWAPRSASDSLTKIRALNYSGEVINNVETQFKVISFDDYKTSRYSGNFSNSLSTIPHIDTSGNTVYPTFTVVPNFNEENLTPFSGTVRIRIDIPKKVADYGSDYQTVLNRFNLISDQIEEIYNDNSTLPFNISIDVFVNSGTTVFDDMTLSDYVNHYDNLGGILKETNYHKGLIISDNKNTSLIGGNYCAVAGNSYNVNSSDTLYSTMAHEIGHTFGVQHLFSRFFRYYDYPNKPEDVWVIDNFKTNSGTSPLYLDGVMCGDFIPYSAQTDGARAVMSYGNPATYSCGTFSYAWGAINKNPYSSYVPDSRDITSGYVNYSDTFNRANITYYDTIETNFTNGTIDNINIYFEYGNYALNGTNFQSVVNVNVTEGLTGNSINIGTLDETNSPLDGSAGLPVIYSAFTYDLSGSNLTNIFDYNNQTEFGVEIVNDILDAGNNAVFHMKNLTLTFTSSGVDTVLRPNNYLTKSYSDSSFTGITGTFKTTSTSFYDYYGLIDVEVDLMTKNAIINKNYYSI